MQHGTPNSRFHVSKCADSPGDTPLLNPDSEFPSFRPPSVGPQRDPKIQIPCFQVCRFQDTPLQIPDSEFPSVQDSKGPSVGPRSRGGTPISKFLVSSWADSRILLRKFQIPRFRVCRFLEHTPGQIPDSEFPSFRGPLLGPSPRDPQIPDSEFPSFRGPLLQGPSPRDPQIPDSEFPSFRGPLYGRPQSEGHPYSRFRVSEFPRPPLAGSKPLSYPYPSPRDPQIPDSEFPSFRGALSGPTRREPKCQIPRFRVSGRPLGLTLHVGYRAADSRIQRAVSISAPVPILNPRAPHIANIATAS